MSLPPRGLALVRSVLGPISRVEPIRGGQHTTFRVIAANDAIVKVFPAGHTGFATERAALQLLRGRLPVPELYASLEDDEGGYLVLSYVPARSLAELVAGRRGASDRALVEAARMASRVHASLRALPAASSAFAIDPLARLGRAGAFDRNAFACQIAGARVIGPARGERVLRVLDAKRPVLDAMGSTSQVIHGDFQPRNLLVDAESRVAAVLDWELARVAPVLCDLAMLLRFCTDAAAEHATLRAYDDLPWSVEETRIAARCYDIAKVTLGMSKVTTPTSDAALWLDYLDGCIEFVERGATERMRGAAARLLYYAA
jgi:Ser/Thr protein kinase RdoA (MazF antagonist)